MDNTFLQLISLLIDTANQLAAAKQRISELESHQCPTIPEAI